MTSLPLPVRVAAGLAAAAAREARNLPSQVVGLPVTVASQVLQWSMRAQQQITELAIRGDEVLAHLRPVEETPEWATFDEDEPEPGAEPEPSRADWWVRPRSRTSAFDRAKVREPDAAEEPASSAESAESGEPSEPAESAVPGPAALPGYDGLTLPQLRGRLRRLSADDLAELLHHERAHANRDRFVRMLANRIDTVQRQTGEGAAAPRSAGNGAAGNRSAGGRSEGRQP